VPPTLLARADEVIENDAARDGRRPRANSASNPGGKCCVVQLVMAPFDLSWRYGKSWPNVFESAGRGAWMPV
jgi:hypothetical protein